MEHFYTLQGEGFYSGQAAYFIRLGGCDVGCVWCDVKDSWDADKHPKMSTDEIVGIDELKVVVFNKSDFKWAEEHAAKVSEKCRLYLQPEWSKRDEMTPLIIDYIKQHPQWQLSLQSHKYTNIP